VYCPVFCIVDNTYNILQANLRHSQTEARRKARLVQVREQERSLARQLRERVRNKRDSERRLLQQHVDTVLAETHQGELKDLEEKYLSRVNVVGQGHRDAQQVSEVRTSINIHKTATCIYTCSYI